MGLGKGVASPSEREARAELSSVLASPAFVRSPRMAKLLEYLCAKYLEGQTDQLKEYSIAVEVLGRPDSFNPAEDAIARVEVHRLRRKLREYYEVEGAGSTLRIVIPSGNYAPMFVPFEPGSDLPVSLTTNAIEVAQAPDLKASLTSALTTAGQVSVGSQGQVRSPGPDWKRWAAVLAGVGLIAGLTAVGFLWLSGRPAATPAKAAVVRGASLAVPPAAPVAVVTPPITAGSSREVRILCGQRKPHTDRLGHVWGVDRYFEGGSYAERQLRFMTRTSDPAIFQNARSGDFFYHIPLPAGVYELHLYFSETVYGPGTSTGGGENSRVFNITANSKPILTAFDIVSDAGGAYIADERIFKDISPASDGKLHLAFLSQRAQAVVSAIEVVPSQPRHQNPIRIFAQENSYTDSNGVLWSPDNYWSGGQTAIHGVSLQGTRDPDLFARERYGNFSYAIPADAGNYAVSLHLAEGYWGAEEPGAGGPGRRVFDIFCNGVALARNFDISKEAGGASRALIKTFHGLRPNGQGKLLLSFVPVANYASVYAIEVLDETR
jgi:hypothetical protein